MLRVRPTLGSGSSLTAMLNPAEKPTRHSDSGRQRSHLPGGLRLLLNRGFPLERGIKPCSVRPGNEPQFPLSDIPFQEILDRAANGVYQAKPVRTFMFDEIRDAHRLMESNQANGKIVVKVASA